MDRPPALSRLVEVAKVPPSGLDLDVTATQAECSALAAAYELVAVDGLAATVKASRDGDGVIAVSGRLAADIVQTCVVGLAPVPAQIDEPFAVRFAAADSPALPDPPKPGAEIAVDPDAPDPPEVLAGRAVDVGAVVEEHFALAIDPYPRAPDAAPPADLANPPPKGGDSPFSALAALKPRPPQKRQ